MIPCEYEDLSSAVDGLALACRDEKWGCNDELDVLPDGRMVVTYPYGYQVLDRAGNVVFTDNWMSDRYVFIIDFLLAIGSVAGGPGIDFFGGSSCTYSIVNLKDGSVLLDDDDYHLRHSPFENLIWVTRSNWGGSLHGYLNVTTGELLPAEGSLFKDDALYLYHEGTITAYDTQGNRLP